MGGEAVLQPKEVPPVSQKKDMPSVSKLWSERTGIPQHLYSRSDEFTKEHGDMSKLDKYGRPTHTKDGDLILRFR